VEVPVEAENKYVHCCEEEPVHVACQKRWYHIFWQIQTCALTSARRIYHLPPNNNRRKKLYHQMMLHIQEGMVQKGVGHKLLTWVEVGTHELFPLTTFMGSYWKHEEHENLG
jgi:hypothetical protein